MNTCWLCGIHKERRPREEAADPLCSTASVEHAGDCCQKTSHDNPESQESNRCDFMHVLCTQIFLLLTARNKASRIVCTYDIQLNWLDTGTPMDVSGVRRPWLRDLRVITRSSAERESSKPCLQMLPSVRVRDAHERMSRPASEAEPNMKECDFLNSRRHLFPITDIICVCHAWWIIFVISSATINSHCFACAT